MNIQTTKDYSKFKMILGNRPLNRSNLKKITKAIAQKNMLDISPIIINENWEIIDGQHRFQIAKENGYPIHYMMLDGGNLSDVHSLNNISRKWNSEDYVKSFAMQGNTSYRRLAKFMEDTGYRVGPSIMFIKEHGGGGMNTQLKSGLVDINQSEIEEAHNRVKYYEDILNYYDGPSGRQEYLIRAILVLMKSGFADKLLEAFEKRDAKFTHQPTAVGYLREFEGILNWKKRDGNEVRLF